MTTPPLQYHQESAHRENDLSDELMTLEEACQRLFGGQITPATLRAENRRGNLVIERIGRRDFVTRAGIKEMRRQCVVAQQQKDRGSGFNPHANARPEQLNQLSGSFATTVEESVALAALQMTVERLSVRSRAT